MRHLSDGTLRRIYDEPLALTAAEQEHFDSCRECHARFEAIANGARAITGWLAAPAIDAQPQVALAGLRQRIDAQAAQPAPWYQRWMDRNSPRFRPLATPAVAIGLAAVLVTGGATGVATHFIRVFQPTQVTAIQVSPSAVRHGALLLDYGTLKWLPSPPEPKVVSDASTAHAQSGLAVLLPASLPSGISGPVTYGIVPQATASLTFDAARLQASAAKARVSVKPMPSSIDGSTLIVNGGPALLEVWGASPGGTLQQFPTLVIAQTKAPTVDSTGASRAQLEDYLLSQPGVPPDLAAQLKAIKDPSSTLPIPIPTGYATTEQVQVNGVQGTMIKATLGAAVVWVKDGVIYAVGGQLTPDQVLAIASSLH